MIKSIELALARFLSSENTTVAKLFDDLDPEDKATALEAYFRLTPEQQEAVVSFLTNEAGRATCGFLCYLAARADENESVLVDENLSAATGL